MRARNVVTLVVTFALPVAVLAQAPGGTVTKRAAASAQSRLLVMPASDLKWTDLDPGAPGVKVADLWGNHDMKVVIISGTYVQAPEGKPEFRLAAGSYFMQPGGSYRHTTTCDKASDCVFFVESVGPFDLKPVDAGTAPTK
jgi:hypothetical protein